MDTGTRVCRRELHRAQHCDTGWTELGAAWGGTEWPLRCSQAKPAWDSITASAAGEEELPHLHQAAPFPLHSPGAALAPSRSGLAQKAPVPGVAGALGAGQPATLHLPTWELPAGAQGSTGTAMVLAAQPRRHQFLWKSRKTLLLLFQHWAQPVQGP